MSLRLTGGTVVRPKTVQQHCFPWWHSFFIFFAGMHHRAEPWDERSNHFVVWLHPLLDLPSSACRTSSDRLKKRETCQVIAAVIRICQFRISLETDEPIEKNDGYNTALYSIPECARLCNNFKICIKFMTNKNKIIFSQLRLQMKVTVKHTQDQRHFQEIENTAGSGFGTERKSIFLDGDDALSTNVSIFMQRKKYILELQMYR